MLAVPLATQGRLAAFSASSQWWATGREVPTGQREAYIITKGLRINRSHTLFAFCSERIQK